MFFCYGFFEGSLPVIVMPIFCVFESKLFNGQDTAQINNKLLVSGMIWEEKIINV